MKKESGQTLLMVVVIMVIVLTIGIALSWRVLSNLSRTSSTDTSARVRAVAEGGAENFLNKSLSELQQAAVLCDGNYNSGVPVECQIDFPAQQGTDPIASYAVVTVVPYGAGTNALPISSSASEVVEVNLTGYNGNFIVVCWNENTVLKYTEYSDTDVKTDVRKCRNCNLALQLENIPEAQPGSAYGQSARQCVRVNNVAGNLQGLRLTSLGGTSNFTIVPRNGSLPIQGYKITSVGQLDDETAFQPIKQTVVVSKSLPYLPLMFDFSIYSDTGVLD